MVQVFKLLMSLATLDVTDRIVVTNLNLLRFYLMVWQFLDLQHEDSSAGKISSVITEHFKLIFWHFLDFLHYFSAVECSCCLHVEIKNANDRDGVTAWERVRELLQLRNEDTWGVFSWVCRPVPVIHIFRQNKRQVHVVGRGTAYCIWSVISPISKLNRISSSLCLFCRIPIKRDQLVENGERDSFFLGWDQMTLQIDRGSSVKVKHSFENWAIYKNLYMCSDFAVVWGPWRFSASEIDFVRGYVGTTLGWFFWNRGFFKRRRIYCYLETIISTRFFAWVVPLSMDCQCNHTLTVAPVSYEQSCLHRSPKHDSGASVAGRLGKHESTVGDGHRRVGRAGF